MSNEPTIAISGKSGCGNSTVSRIVAEKLGLNLINYTFKSIAAERGMTFEEVCRLAETDDSYDRYVDERQVKLASEGNCVLGSRLAIWLLSKSDLTIYLNASLSVRARRISEREGGELEQVTRETGERDARDRQRYIRLYDIDIDQFEFADMVVSADDATQFEIAELIIERFGSIDTNQN